MFSVWKALSTYKLSFPVKDNKQLLCGLCHPAINRHDALCFSLPYVFVWRICQWSCTFIGSGCVAYGHTAFGRAALKTNHHGLFNQHALGKVKRRGLPADAEVVHRGSFVFHAFKPTLPMCEHRGQIIQPALTRLGWWFEICHGLVRHECPGCTAHRLDRLCVGRQPSIPLQCLQALVAQGMQRRTILFARLQAMLCLSQSNLLVTVRCV